MRTFICNFWEYIVIFSVILGIVSPFIHGIKKHKQQNQKEDKHTSNSLFNFIIGLCVVFTLSITAYYYQTSSKVLDVVGSSVSNAVQTLQETDFNIEILPIEYSMSDIIVEQRPNAGEYLSKGSTVYLYIEHLDSPDSSDKKDAKDKQTASGNAASNPDNLINETGSIETDTSLSTNDENKNPGLSIVAPPSTSTSASTTVQDPVLPNSNPEDIDLPEQNSSWNDVLVPGRYLYLKASYEDEGSLTYVDSEDVTHHISDPDISDIKTYKISLYADSSKAIGDDINITLESGAGVGLSETFYDGMSFEISAGTYVVELIGEPYTSGPYIENEDGSVTYGRQVFTETITVDHDGDYILNIE